MIARPDPFFHDPFFHVLLIQSRFVIYIRDSVGEIDLLKPWPSFVLVVKAFAVGLISLITAVAAWTWYHGFSELNGFLWKNWEENIEAINARQKDKDIAVSSSTVKLKDDIVPNDPSPNDAPST